MKKLLKSKPSNFFLVIFLVGIIITVPTFFLYQHIVEMVRTETNKQAEVVALSVAKFIETDIKKYDKLSSVQNYSEGNYDSDYYKNMCSLLKEIKTETGAKFIYTEKRLSEKEVIYILDAEKTGSQNYSPPGSKDEISEIEKKAFAITKGALSGSTVFENWGELLSAFAPIRNVNTGETLGLVGVDFSLVYVEKIIKGLRILFIIGFLGAVLLAVTVIKVLFTLISHNINTDYMTKLYNKRFYDKSIRKTIEKGHIFSLVIIDINDFKVVNDRFGHVTGDNIIKETAGLIKESTRHEDLCFRYGGDEFAVILPNTNKRQADLIGKRIQSRILLGNLRTKCLSGFNLSVSVGVAQWKPEMSPQDLTESADKAMYLSKKQK